MRNNGLVRTAAETIRRYDMLRPGETVLAALSGGADSVSLLLVLQSLGYEVRAFHLNHCLRGAESDRDEAFCRALCEKRGVPLTVVRVDIAALSQGKAVEETARRERYAQLEKAADGCKIATAHTADDNLETVLFHLVRGSGARGLAGIPPRAGQYHPAASERGAARNRGVPARKRAGLRHRQLKSQRRLHAEPPAAQRAARAA